MTTDNTSPRAGLDLDAVEARANAASNGPWRLHSWEDSDGAGHITIETARVGGLGDMIADVQVSRLPEIRRAEEGAPDAPLPPRLAAGIARIDRGDDCIEHELTVDMLVSDATFIAHARQDVPALLAEARRLRGLLDATAQAFDGLVAQVRRAAGETHEPPADVAAMLARVTALRESHRERSEALLTARRWADDAQRLLDAKEGTGREEELARQLHADAGARVTAARRDGAEAMREAAARAVAAEARSADARADRCGGDSNSRRAAIEVSATCDDLADAIRALPLPGGGS